MDGYDRLQNLPASAVSNETLHGIGCMHRVVVISIFCWYSELLMLWAVGITITKTRSTCM